MKSIFQFVIFFAYHSITLYNICTSICRAFDSRFCVNFFFLQQWAAPLLLCYFNLLRLSFVFVYVYTIHASNESYPSPFDSPPIFLSCVYLFSNILFRFHSEWISIQNSHIIQSGINVIMLDTVRRIILDHWNKLQPCRSFRFIFFFGFRGKFSE